MSQKLKMLYIMGTARSGSTILEILLARGRHCVGVGELSAIVQDGFIENKPCSCGSTFYQCDFWSQIVRRLALSNERIEEWACVQRKIDWHTGFFRQMLGLVSKCDWEQYQALNVQLLQAIHDVSGAAVIVDSSKYAGRALALGRLSEVDLSVICLTRSPEGLMNSFRKPNKDEQRPKRPWAVFRYYAFVVLSLRIAAARLKDRVIAQSYEDFLAEPASGLRKITNVFDVDLSGVIMAVENGESFEVGHLVTGNRLRKSKSVRLMRPKDEEVAFRSAEKLPIALMKWLR